MPVGRDTSISQIAESCLETVAQDKYDGDDPRFQGKTRLEAAVLSLAKDATLDADARREFLDRIMGKPKQRVDSVNVNMNLNDYLKQIADEENKAIEAEFVANDLEDMFK